jgi:hypothetical protein
MSAARLVQEAQRDDQVLACVRRSPCARSACGRRLCVWNNAAEPARPINPTTIMMAL